MTPAEQFYLAAIALMAAVVLVMVALACADRLRTAVDKRVCRLSNDLSGDDGGE